MASISYDKIFSNFLGSIDDVAITTLDESDAIALMTEYLHKSVTDPYVAKLFTSKSLDDQLQVFTYEMKAASDAATDEEFIAVAIAKWMIYEWYLNKKNTTLLTSQFFGGAEQKMYSQAQHMSEVRGLCDDAYKEARFFIQSRGYINNAYLQGGA